MNRLPVEKRVQIVAALVEGNGIRATARMADVSTNTVMKLLADLGTACSEFQDKALQNLNCKRIQVDEIWSFCYSKQKNVPEKHRGEFGYGDVWTWTAIDADTKLVPSWHVGLRSASDAATFIEDLASRLASHVQITSDGLRVYIDAIEGAFGADVDYAMLVKLYGSDPDNERRYSPAVCTGIEKTTINGDPDPKHVSTSFVERQNLTMRMSMRRFTRLTNAFSKKVQNHAAAIALHFMWYNFGRIHKTLRCTPAMEAKVTDHVWTIAEIVGLLDA